MPEPGSFKFDVARTRLRNEGESDRMPTALDGHALATGTLIGLSAR